MPVTAREAALKALTEMRRRGARPDIILGNLCEKGELSRRDMALSNNIVNGVIQNRMFCDYYVTLFSGRKTDYFEPVILDILRIGAYQLFFLTKIPPHAAVSEGVTLAKKNSRGAAGIVNAVLRKLADSRDSLPEIDARDEAEYLSIKYSHPDWLVRELASSFGAEKCENILRANNTPAPTTVIVNTLKCGTNALIESLNAESVKCEPHPVIANALNISDYGSLPSLDSFKKGLFFVQDAAANLAVCAASPKSGDTVFDVCAAPGGKSFASAVMMGNAGTIYSADVHENKLRLIKDGAARLGIDIITALANDGRKVNENLKNSCDVVLCDVPCSGFGVIRKKPEIRYKDPAELSRLPEVQLAILSASAQCVRSGGTLLYSTCTLLKRENEEVAERFLAENSDFTLQKFTLPAPFGECDGMLTIPGDDGNTDGFFICRMVKK